MTRSPDPYRAARFGVLACLLFMAGGFVWTAAIDSDHSALTAYPVMVSIGVAFTLMIFGRPSGPRRSCAALGVQKVASKTTYDPVTGLP